MPTSNSTASTPEHLRLSEDGKRTDNWKRWGPYLSERQWGTVREDYSADGDAWNYFPHEQARSRVYRWGEDGLLGFCDRECRLCFSVAMWNGRDPILKERLFGLTGPQGNHGEDVKECYYYLDSSPTHSYVKGMYRYPHAEFPYEQLVEENQRRSLSEREYELADTGVFDQNRFFDVYIEYAKADSNDVLIRMTVNNCGPEAETVWLMPTVWFRNTWIWGCRHEGCTLKPAMHEGNCPDSAAHRVETTHETLGDFRFDFGHHPNGDQTQLLFTENETNTKLLFGTDNYTPYVKDAFHRYLIDGEHDAVSPKRHGTKVTVPYQLRLEPGQQQTIIARLSKSDSSLETPFDEHFTTTIEKRIDETNQFYATIIPDASDEEEHAVARQAYAGLLWTKQFYHYIVSDWLQGDLNVSAPPDARQQGRNHNWTHIYARDVLSMPDKWEYPWFAAWDLAFHMIPMCRLDPHFAKRQLLVLLREWYMHPNGQMPAYEYAFSDVNPPVHAWACFRVYQMTGSKDRDFLAKAFQRLLLNFTWWVNQVDANGDNVFAGGFLGLDNIGVFDRSKGLPDNSSLEQADGTAWMAFYCGTMLSIALELAREDEAYAEMASKFLDHFVRISDAMNTLDGGGLWDEEDGFYYDYLHFDDRSVPLKVRSLVGLLPLIAVEILDEPLVERLPSFLHRLRWFLRYRHDLAKHISFAEAEDGMQKMLLAIPARKKLERVLSVLLDEKEFLSPFGIRSLSKHHEQHPFELEAHGEVHRVAYVPGESDSWMFGGNSNWRGPIWFPINFLLIEALERYHSFYGDDFQVECPTGSGKMMTLDEVSKELNRRLTKLFLTPKADQPRPCLSAAPNASRSWQRHLLFHEYFNGDTGEGLGASHQTGWTALVAQCIEKLVQN